MVMLLTSSSKHVIVGPHLILIKNKTEVREITSKRKKFTISEMISGKYTFLVKLLFLRPSALDADLTFKYKLGMNKGEKIVNFREQDQSLKFLDTSLEYVTPEYLQLSLANAFGKEDIVIKSVGSSHKRIFLKPQETQKVIIVKEELNDYSISYEIKSMFILL